MVAPDVRPLVFSYHQDIDAPSFKPQSVLRGLYEVTGGDAYATSDVGQHQMWAAQFYPFDKPRRVSVIEFPGYGGRYIEPMLNSDWNYQLHP